MENTTTLHSTTKPSSLIAPAVSTAAPKPKLLDQLRQAIRTAK